jgi:hypothetical protein
MKPHCSIETLRENLSYDPASGKLRWKRQAGGRASGDVAGGWSYTGYIHVRVFGKMYQAHRIAWAIHYGEWPATGIDHINGNGADNRIENLRCVPQAQNNKNAKRRIDNTSGVTGVLWYKANRKWGAKIHHEGSYIFLGLFEKMEDAIAARKQAEVKFGFHQNHGRAA